MKCPVCQNVDLKMTERQGVEIDYCPNCRGVWLDRGELDKIIERAAASEGFPPGGQRPQQAPPPPQQGYPQQGYNQQPPPQPYPQRRYDDDDDDYYRRQGYPVDPYTGKPKRKSTLGELFDIFD